ncbi:hypothetical protein GQ457_01G023350 [Hibiscus cannabinus]
MSYQQGDDFYYMDEDFLTKVTGTSSAQARKGKDIQGIPWERLNITREKYRLTRLEQYKNYENIPASSETVIKECKHVEKGGNYYEFFHNTRLVKPTILHFQKNEELEQHSFSWLQWHLDRKGVAFCTRTTYDDNAITNAIEIYDRLGGGINFMASNNDCSLREYDIENFQLLNHFRYPWPVNFFHNPSCSILYLMLVGFGWDGYMQFFKSHNKIFWSLLRIMLILFILMQYTSISPDQRLITVVGDHLDGLLVDLQNGKV